MNGQHQNSQPGAQNASANFLQATYPNSGLAFLEKTVFQPLRRAGNLCPHEWKRNEEVQNLISESAQSENGKPFPTQDN